MAYRKEKTIIASAYAISAFLLLNFVPKNKIRYAIVPFLFKQVLTWLFGLLVVEKNLIKYPYRAFFSKTYKASFCFEYFFYPVLCVIFNLYYPEKRNLAVKGIYYFLYTSFIVGLEVLFMKYTKLIRYKKWHWYWSFITLWFTSYLSHVFYKWFFKGNIINNLN
jgi:hypothetical protein